MQTIEGVVKVGDDRKLAYTIHGPHPSESPAVIYMHGSPGSRCGPMIRPFRLHTLGVSLVSFDRPGYGESTRHEGRSIADTARDTEMLADHLDIERFAVMGRSGGVPYALACAALFGERVSAVAGLVGIALYEDAKGDRSRMEGMVDENIALHESAQGDGEAMRRQYEALSAAVSQNPDSFIGDFLWRQMSEKDQEFFQESVVMRELHAVAFQRALAAQRGAGWVDDTIAINQPAGFQLTDIQQPTSLWHGKMDNFSPVENTYSMAREICAGGNRQVRVVIDPRQGHFGALTVIEKELAWLRDVGA